MTGRVPARATPSPAGKQASKKRRSLPAAATGAIQLLTIDQVAERLCVHRTTVYDFINRSGLRVTRLGPHVVRVDEADLQIWIQKRKEAS